jgi:hypothetical protein
VQNILHTYHHTFILFDDALHVGLTRSRYAITRFNFAHVMLLRPLRRFNHLYSFPTALKYTLNKSSRLPTAQK